MKNINSFLGIVLPKQTLENKESIDSAFKAFTDSTRFDSFEFDNETDFCTASLVLFQGLDQSGLPLRPGYVNDTGVTVGGVNVTENSGQTTVLQPQIKCLATRVKCSANIVFTDGSGRPEEVITCPDQVANAGEYFVKAACAIQPAPENTKYKKVLFVELKDSAGKKRSFSYHF